LPCSENLQTVALSNSLTSVLTVSRTNRLPKYVSSTIEPPPDRSSRDPDRCFKRRLSPCAPAARRSSRNCATTCHAIWRGTHVGAAGQGDRARGPAAVCRARRSGSGAVAGGVRCHQLERRSDVPAAPVGITQSLWPQCGKRCAAFTACRRPSRWWSTALGTPALKRSPRWRSVPAAVPAASPSPMARVRRRGCFPAARLRRGWVRTPRRGPDKPAQPIPPAHASLRSVADARPATNSGQNPRTSSLRSDRCARPLSTPCSGGPGMRSTCPAGT